MDEDVARALLLALPAGARRTPPPPQNWRHMGSCRDSDPNLFYPLGRGAEALEQAEEAKVHCQTCPSREPCLAFALSTRQDLGVWGGTSPEERRLLLRSRGTAVAS
jgi:WhiB family transcriptional regulator, redox-sensing transcriptional regulator